MVVKNLRSRLEVEFRQLKHMAEFSMNLSGYIFLYKKIKFTVQCPFDYCTDCKGVRCS